MNNAILLLSSNAWRQKINTSSGAQRGGVCGVRSGLGWGRWRRNPYWATRTGGGAEVREAASRVPAAASWTLPWHPQVLAPAGTTRPVTSPTVCTVLDIFSGSIYVWRHIIYRKLNCYYLFHHLSTKVWSKKAHGHEVSAETSCTALWYFGDDKFSSLPPGVFRNVFSQHKLGVFFFPFFFVLLTQL